jgi:hypothetical protein
MNPWVACGLTIVVLGCASVVLKRCAQTRSAQASHHCAKLLDGMLTLMQLMQKHRGLGAQQSGVAVMQREQIALEIDRQWNYWQDQLPGVAQLQSLWTTLKIQPADFVAHCQMIDHLLSAISLLERRMDEHKNTTAGVIAERCRGLEDLARLRGLSSRAANHVHCPIELEVPLRYLGRRLNASDFQRNENAVRAALTEINQRMLDAEHISITATRCFELLTPIIDSALDDVRNSIRQWRPSRVLN